MPVDDDNDDLFDEDGPEDLNGNGVIEQIRKYVPGQGNTAEERRRPAHRSSRCRPGETGDYILLGQEGVDHDGDGRVGEDGPGSYDPNRNFAADWQPNYIQGGAMDYPFQLPEAKAVNDFLLAHPNIAGLQTYHNNGGMILRSPGAERTGEYPASDVRVYDELGRNGERMLPFYRYLVIWSGLYTVHGGVTDWTNDGLGILSFSNELWNDGQYFNSPELKEQQKDPDSPIAPRVANYFFNDYLEFGDEFTEWKEFDHPQFGKVEIGGAFKKTFGRVPPRFMNEELCHRNMAFTLYQADEMPKMSIGETKVEKLGDGILQGLGGPRERQGHADDPREGRREQRRAARPAHARRQGCRGAVGQLGAEQVAAGRGADDRPEGPEADHDPQRAAWPVHEDDAVPREGRRQHHGEVREREGRNGAEDDRAAVGPASQPAYGGLFKPRERVVNPLRAPRERSRVCDGSPPD